MAESEKTSSAEPTTNSLGLKAFNKTGREDTTTEIIKPQADPKVQQRNLLLIAVVIVAFVVAGYITFERSGLNLHDIFNDEKQTSFGTAPNAVRRNVDSPN